LTVYQTPDIPNGDMKASLRHWSDSPIQSIVANAHAEINYWNGRTVQHSAAVVSDIRDISRIEAPPSGTVTQSLHEQSGRSERKMLLAKLQLESCPW